MDTTTRNKTTTGTATQSADPRLVRTGRALELLALLGVVTVVTVAVIVAAIIHGYRLADLFFPASGSFWIVAVIVIAVAAGILGGLVRGHFSHAGRDARKLTDLGRGGREVRVEAADGTVLHVEVDGPDDPDLTVVFMHGWLMDISSWHLQRAALNAYAGAARVRRVFVDQRGHGRSQWRGLDRGERGVRQLADDLDAVISAVAPDGPIVLVGHSMGGMSVLAFADRHLPVLRERGAGVLLCATGAGPLSAHLRLGLPRWAVPLHRVVRRYAVALIDLLGLIPVPVVRMAGIGPWLLAAKMFACAPGALDSAVSVTTGAMWRTPLHVGASLLESVMNHEESDLVPVLVEATPTTVINAGLDRLIPPDTGGDRLADLAADARVLRVVDSGHMVMLEAPAVVNAELLALVDAALQVPGAEPV